MRHGLNLREISTSPGKWYQAGRERDCALQSANEVQCFFVPVRETQMGLVFGKPYIYIFTALSKIVLNDGPFGRTWGNRVANGITGLWLSGLSAKCDQISCQ